ncbi:MAG TPA: 3-phosphoshikimate 1-carboxyvinyltransferase [Tepidisphaeraceae bacterium]|jgi:3-phosphoshikimate 1-carboxyvinyltransferase|nr:3-phosphoshikimate 1-carboxyvinyltransferase [Tepidisphaeraceae bacterium]
MSDVTLQPVRKPFSAEFTPPGSKSLTNRTLVIAALASGASRLTNCLFADDTQVMIESLRRLGIQLEVDETSAQILVHGGDGRIPNREADLYCGNSGTSTRFLTAMTSVGRGKYVLDGNARMRQRPIGQLVDMLRNLGVRIQYLMEEGFPPLEVLADGLPGGMVRFADAESSQFLSAALLACPYARNEVRIDLEGQQTSWPYVAMTMQLMDHFAVTPELYRDPRTGLPKQIHIPRGQYQGTDYEVEPDASNASYFLAAAALHPGSKITVKGLGKRSLQGDVAFADVLHRMGADLIFGPDFITMIGPERLEAIDIDMRNMPDMAQTLAVVALFAEGDSTLRGLHTLRKKETDRIAALATELKKFNAGVEVEEDSLIISPPGHIRHGSVATYDDHRMAMSFALAGTRIEHVTIRDAECVNKTYPRFFEDLRRVIGT